MKKRLTDARIKEEKATWQKGQKVLRDTDCIGYMAVIGAKGVALSLHTEAGRRKLADWNGSNVEEIRTLAYATKAKGFATGPTLQEAWNEYRIELRRRNKSEVTIKNYCDLIERVMKPLLDVRLDVLSDDNRPLRDIFNELSDAGKLHQADNTVRAISAVYNHTRKVNKKLLPDPDGPMYGIQLHKPPAKKTTVKDLPAWNEKRLALPSKLRQEMHLFTLLSGARKTDLLTARWENLDVPNRALLFPSPKGGEEKAYRLPLSRIMLACLNRIKKEGRFLVDGSPWLFPATGSASGHISENKENGHPDFEYGHKLRKTYGTIAYGVTGDEPFVERMLNHEPRGVTGRRYIDFDAVHIGYVEAQEEISKEIIKRLC